MKGWKFNFYDIDGRCVDTAVFYADSEAEAWILAGEHADGNEFVDYELD